MTAQKRAKMIIICCVSVAAAIIGVLIALAYQHTIVVPYLSPTIVIVDGLRPEYEQGDMVNYNVKVSGYGSNCLSLELRTYRISNGNEDDAVYYYKKADDCKHMEISYSQYNYTRAFTYGGPPITGTPGKYKVTIDFIDLVSNQKASTNGFFTVAG